MPYSVLQAAGVPCADLVRRIALPEAHRFGKVGSDRNFDDRIASG